MATLAAHNGDLDGDLAGRETTPARGQVTLLMRRPRLLRRAAGGAEGGIFKDRYSRFVEAMKFTLPALAACMMALVLLWPNVGFDDGRFRVGFLSTLKLGNLENLTLVRARYTGIDDKKRPYTVTAEMANQISPTSDRIQLSVPAADITLEDGKWIALTAKSGEFQQDSQKLTLTGNVSIFHDDGYSFQTESMMINLKQGDARGDAPVVGYGPLGTLRAEGFRIIDKGRRIIFTGRAHMVIRRKGGAGLSPQMRNYMR